MFIHNLIFVFTFFRNPGQKAEVSLRLSEAVLALKESGEGEIPKQHRLDVTTVTRQMLGVFSHVAGKFDKISKFNIFFSLIYLLLISQPLQAQMQLFQKQRNSLWKEGLYRN